MKPYFSLALWLCAVILAGGSAQALESRLPYGASLPAPNAENARNLAYIEATHVGSTLLQRIESENFALELSEREKKIQSLPNASDRVLPDFQRILVTEGFDAFNILSDSPTPRFKTRLKHSVCVVLQTKRKQANPPMPLLISTRLSDAKSTAAMFGIAKLFESFRIETQSPLWMCARSDNASSCEELASKQRFSTHILLSGTSPNAFINYQGQEATQLLFRERAWDWLREDSNTAQKAAQHVIQALSGVKSRWDIDKKSPWSKTEFSPIQCKKSFISSVRNTCWFNVTVTSRSQVALSEQTQALLRLALAETRKMNKSLASPKGKPAVTLSLPKNRHVKPVAGTPEAMPILFSWSTALADTPNRVGYISSRFISPEAIGNKAQNIPLLTLSAYGNEAPDTAARLSILAKTLLLASDARLQ